MRTFVRKTVEEVAEVAAEHVVQLIRAHPEMVLGVATGSSPLPLYAALSRRAAAGEVSFADVTAVALDEYLGLPPEHPETYRNVLRREVGERLGIQPSQIVVPDGATSDPDAAAAELERSLSHLGGVDLQILGVGTNGHIGFNEPGSALDSRTRPVVLSGRTRAANARFFGGDVTLVPSRAITQGIGTILAARRLLVVATGAAKAGAVAAAIRGPITAECPASSVRLHPDVTIVLDEAAAALLRVG